MSKPKILLVGAGAVGQAYGFHLSCSGAAITFYVKSKYLDTLGNGLKVRCLNGQYRGIHDFEQYACISTLEEVAKEKWDQVWLCVSSPALHSGWVPSLLALVGEATVVTLQPGVHDYEYLSQCIDRSRLVRGMITLASYPGPLAQSVGPKTMTWWFPPFTPAPFSGDSNRVRSVVKSLRGGGFPARKVHDVSAQLRFSSALFMPLIAALEKNHWSFKKLRTSGDLRLAGDAGREAVELVLPGQYRWRKTCLTHPLVLRLIMRIAPLVTPFPLEDMLRIHFTKVGEQTRSLLKAYIALAHDRDAANQSLVKLLGALSAP